MIFFKCNGIGLKLIYRFNKLGDILRNDIFCVLAPIAASILFCVSSSSLAKRVSRTSGKDTAKSGTRALAN